MRVGGVPVNGDENMTFASKTQEAPCPHRFWHLYAVHDDAVERVITYECDACPAQYSMVLDKDSGNWHSTEVGG